MNFVATTFSARRLLLILYAGLLAGCAVGPDFQRPSPPAGEGYTAQEQPAQTVTAENKLGAAQHFVAGAAPDAAWWHAFGSPELDALIERALQSSPTLEAAQATLRQAQHLYEARAGATQLPQVNAAAGAQRQQVNNIAAGQSGGERTYSLYHAGVGVSYNLDLFGGNRRALEALAARAEYQRFQHEGARLTLAANIVTTAIIQAQLAAQIEASIASLAAQEAQLEVTRRRFALGAAARNDVLALQTLVEQTRAGIPALQTEHDRLTHLLAVLAGQPPGAAGMPVFTLADFTLPVELPVSLPSELARRRPDIQAAEALLRAANAEYGTAVARLYPQITLSADAASQALTSAGLFGSGTLVWGLAGQLTQPLFHGGLRDEARAAQAGFDAAAAHYRETVLQGLRNVADVLRALDNDARILAAQAAASNAAQESLALVEQQYELGAASYLQLLIARQQFQQTRRDLIAAQARRLTDTAALYQAMGGGWLQAEPVGLTGKEASR